MTVPNFTVGEFGDGSKPARPVRDGEQDGANRVSVTCRVRPSGANFEVEANIATAGDTTFTLLATVDAQGKSAAGAMTLKKTTQWTHPTCDLAILTPQQGVAAGRYWAHITCASSVTDPPATCDIFGELRIENCAQQ